MKNIMLTISFFILVFLNSVGNNGVQEHGLMVKPVVKYEVVYITIYENLVGTVYHPVEGQTDDTPLITADNTHIDPITLNNDRYVALSRNLIKQNDKIRKWNGKIPFGTKIVIESPHDEINGEWTVHDTMNKRYMRNVDFFQNHEDPTSIYGKWYGLKIKIEVTFKRTYVGDNIVYEEVV